MLAHETRSEVHFTSHGGIYFSLGFWPNKVDSAKGYAWTCCKEKDAKILLCVRLLLF